MNNDLNDVAIPKGAVVDGQEVLKVLNRVVGETAKDTGYQLLLGNGDKTFITDKQFDKLAEVKEDGEDKE